MEAEKNQYLPALRFNWLTRFYDPLVRLATKEFPFKRAIIAQANLQNGQNILDLACGTGTLCIGIKKRFPGAKIFAVDADAEILRTAIEKAKRYDAKIHFYQAMSGELPFPDLFFNRIFSTLSFHHLTHGRKIETIREILRVLKYGGEFHLADYGLPAGKSQKVLSNFVRIIDGDETTLENLNGRLGLLLEENGFAKIERTGSFKTILGTLRLFRCTKI